MSIGGCREARPVRVEGKINVTSVIFPSYDFVRAIADDRVNLVMLLPPGTESHSFEPRPLDIITINESDIFIYPGGENSKWVDRILDSLDVSDKVKVLKLMDMVEVVEEEIVEGMEEDDDHEEEDHSPAFDEHVWTSPRNAKVIVAAITEALCTQDSVNANFYRQNAAEYLARLDELDASFRAVVDGAKRKTIIFGDRFPFRYLADAYGLSYFAAFPGCSTDTEPSASTVAFLINKVKSEQVPVIFHIELSNEKLADTISEAAGVKKLLLHSCHNVTRRDFESGANYLDIQKANVENLREALW
ncbi:MAG: metal ABC transporter substrate-binding protein [Treponema sp.]|nr:metal ABC transporter substrate-binding protein [Treponema sp.]